MEEGTNGQGRLRPSGGYERLRAYQTTTIIYDATVTFCDAFITSRKLHEQMTGAARSGRQNISEGSRFSATSAEGELKLVNVARGSQEELLNDYKDFLRQRGLRQWHKDDPEALAVRAVAKQHGDAVLTSGEYRNWLEHPDPAQRANCLICLINQANYLLDRLITRLEQDIIKNGGYREQLTAARLAERDKQRGEPAQPTQQAPSCPQCNKPMRLRTAKQGSNAGSQFWGCSGYPDCKGTRKYGSPSTENRTDRTDLSDKSDNDR